MAIHCPDLVWARQNWGVALMSSCQSTAVVGSLSRKDGVASRESSFSKLKPACVKSSANKFMNFVY